MSQTSDRAPAVEVGPPSDGFDVRVQTLVVGGGACGMVAALSAHEAGQEVLVIEADPIATGSTALSAGLIPAAGTALQSCAGIEDTAELFVEDIRAKAHAENDPVLEASLAEGSAMVIDWLADRHGLPFSVVTDFDYPGHSRRRMHGLPRRTGAELVDALRSACEREGIEIVCGLRANTLHLEGRRAIGVTATHRDVGLERIGCEKLILACNGFGRNRSMVAEHMPEIHEALWFGHDGNDGTAVSWGRAAVARLDHMSAYQGHGNVAHPHGILISWAVVTEGGFQVNSHGRRFWDESQGYSEAARVVLQQPGGIAFTIFDERIASIARQFEDFRNAEVQGALIASDSIEGLAEALGLPADELAGELNGIPVTGADRFGRTFANKPLTSPFWGVRVTGALFHTQGGLCTDGDGRVLHRDGGVLENLFAGGGAASGVSGKGDSGYLSGNGLLSAVVLGYKAGRAAV